MRRIPFFPMLITVLVSLGSYLGCQPPQEIVEQVGQQVEQQFGQQLNNQFGGVLDRATGGAVPGIPISVGGKALPATVPMNLPNRERGNLLIASFNIQRLGPKKLEQPELLRVYADLIRRFDILAMQEITSEDQNTIPQLLRYVNAEGQRYSYVISPRIGRQYFEQYAFIYDTTRVAAQQNFVMRDENDYLHREPFVGRFATLAPNPFTFALINMHTDPGVVNEELRTLANVYVNVANYFYQSPDPEDDVILLGDLNAGPEKFGPLGQVPNLIPTIIGIPTNFTRTKTNDNILVNRVATREYTGRAGAIDFQLAYGITEAQAKLLSDHQPVWAEFTIQEVHDQQIASPGNMSWMR